MGCEVEKQTAIVYHRAEPERRHRVWRHEDLIDFIGSKAFELPSVWVPYTFWALSPNAEVLTTECTDEHRYQKVAEF